MKHTPHLNKGQLEGLLIIVILKDKDPFKGLNLIKIVLQVKIAIKIRSLNFEIPKVVPCMPSSSSKPSFLIIKVFMRGRVCNVNRINITTLMVKGSLSGSLYLFKLYNELFHLPCSLIMALSLFILGACS